MKKRILIAIGLAFALQTQALGADLFTHIENRRSLLDELITDAVDTPHYLEDMYINIIDEFIEQGRAELYGSDTGRAAYTAKCLDVLSAKAESGLRNIGTGNEKSETEAFYGGYGHFLSDMSNSVVELSGFGANIIHAEIGADTTIVQPGTFLPGWSCENGTRSTDSHSGTYSAAVTDTKLSREFYLREGHTYRISFYYKSDANYSFTFGNLSETLGVADGEWKLFSKDFDTLDEFKFTAEFGTIGQYGTLLVDDFSVIDVVTNLECGYNGGFEQTWMEGEFYADTGVINALVGGILHDGAENDIKVMLLLSPHYIPDWFLEAYPDAYAYQEGFLKGDVRDENLRKLWKRHIEAVVSFADNYHSLHSVILSNEPVYNTSYWTSGRGQAFKEDFISWLKAKYNASGTTRIPEEMCVNWGLSSRILWSNINFDWQNEIVSSGAFWDWAEYNNEVFCSWHEWMADTVHGVNPAVKVHIKVFGCGIPFDRNYFDQGIDYERLCNYMDYAGYDGGPDYSSTDSMFETRLYEDFASSISGRQSINSENHTIPNGCSDYSYKQERLNSADLWQGFVHNRNASAMWVWRRHATYTDYKDSVAYRPDVVAGIGENVYHANRLQNELKAISEKEPDVYVLYSKAAVLYQGEEYSNSVLNVYKTALKMGIKVGFVSEKGLSEGKIGNDDTLIIPNVVNLCSDYGFTFAGKTLVIGSLPNKNQYNLSVSFGFSDVTYVTDIESSLEEYGGLTVTKADSSYIDGIDVIGNGNLINICNYTWTDINNVTLGREGIALDLVSGKVIDTSCFNLESFKPVLLLLDNEVSEVSWDAMPKDSGINISWENVSGNVSVYVDGAFYASASGSSENFGIDDLENGREYTITFVHNGISENKRCTPGKGISVNDGRIRNNTGKMAFIKEAVGDYTVETVLEAFGERYFE